MRQKISFILLAGLYFGGAVWFFSERVTFVQPVLAGAHPTNTPVPTPTPTTPPGGGTGCSEDDDCTPPQVCNKQTHKCEDPSAECGNGDCEAGETYVSCSQDCPQDESNLCSTITCADGSSGYTICDPSCTVPDRACWPDCGDAGLPAGGACQDKDDCTGFADCGGGVAGTWECGSNHYCYVAGCNAATPVPATTPIPCGQTCTAGYVNHCDGDNGNNCLANAAGDYQCRLLACDGYNCTCSTPLCGQKPKNPDGSEYDCTADADCQTKDDQSLACETNPDLGAGVCNINACKGYGCTCQHPACGDTCAGDKDCQWSGDDLNQAGLAEDAITLLNKGKCIS